MDRGMGQLPNRTWPYDLKADVSVMRARGVGTGQQVGPELAVTRVQHASTGVTGGNQLQAEGGSGAGPSGAGGAGGSGQAGQPGNSSSNTGQAPGGAGAQGGAGGNAAAADAADGGGEADGGDGGNAGGEAWDVPGTPLIRQLLTPQRLGQLAASYQDRWLQLEVGGSSFSGIGNLLRCHSIWVIVC